MLPHLFVYPPERQTHHGRSWGRRRQEPKRSEKTKRKAEKAEKTTAAEGASDGT